jgi:hypothetical protein
MSEYPYPAALMFEDKHLANARLLTNRLEILPRLPQGGVFVEVGVAFGDFSERVLEVCRPDRFIGIDLFDLHEHEMVFGHSRREIMGDLDHEQFFLNKVSRFAQAAEISTLRGDSVASLETLADESVDIFYVDADHTYEGVKRDLAALKSKVKPDGYIIFNDYAMYNHLCEDGALGVVQAANEFIIENDYEILYYAFQHQMFCDVAVRKIGAA